jgi:tetratricopeptide (TPR) repeat protein
VSSTSFSVPLSDMNFAEQLRVLQVAQGDPAKLALATADFAFPELLETGRMTVKETLETAAIPHWCDAGILAALLESPLEASSARLAQLRKLTVVEPFPARGESALNVHESARLSLRRWLAEDQPVWFRTLSRRAAFHFAADTTPAGRIEWIYHLLCADPERGATELESLDRDWTSCAHPEDRYALAAALRELEDTRLVQGRARVWVLLVTAWARAYRGEVTQLADVAASTLDLARTEKDPRAEADSQCLFGDVLQAQGKLGAAQEAFGKYLTISLRLAEQDPSNAGWQRALAAAHNRVGDVLRAQGKLEAAQAAYEETLAISQRLVGQDPSNAGWQRALAAAHNRVGDVLQAQGKLEAAQAAFRKRLAISRRLAEQDRSNTGWQRDLAAAHSRVGGVLRTQGKLEAAQAAFRKYLAISRRLAEQDRSNTDWQRELAAAHSRVGGVLRTQGKLEAAQKAYGEYLAIIQRLAEQDPSNADWQRELAAAHSRVGGVLRTQGKLGAAQAAFGKDLAISQRLAEQDRVALHGFSGNGGQIESGEGEKASDRKLRISESRKAGQGVTKRGL